MVSPYCQNEIHRVVLEKLDPELREENRHEAIKSMASLVISSPKRQLPRADLLESSEATQLSVLGVSEAKIEKMYQRVFKAQQRPGIKSSAGLLGAIQEIRKLVNLSSNRKFLLGNPNLSKDGLLQEANTIKEWIADSWPETEGVLEQIFDVAKTKIQVNPRAQSAGDYLLARNFLTPVPYNPELYEQLLPYTKLLFAVEQNGIPEEIAYKLSALFDSPRSAIKYLENYGKENPKELLQHQATMFPLPQGELNWKVWKSLFSKYGGDKVYRQQIFPQAAELESNLISANKEGLADSKVVKVLSKEISKVRKNLKALGRHRGEFENEDEEEFERLDSRLLELQMELAGMGIPFNSKIPLNALKAHVEKLKLESVGSYGIFRRNHLTGKDFEKFQSLERCDDNEKVPNVLIDGEEFGHPGFYLMKVPVLDELHAAHAACFGRLTRCCQSLSGEAGEECAVHGLTSPNGGFYVLCEGDIDSASVEDKVISQSWVWRSKEDAIVFDSIESVDDSTKSKEVSRALFRAAARQISMSS